MSATRSAYEFELTLYVSGASDRAARAVADARALCDRYLPDCHSLVIVDIHDDPAAFFDSGALAAPALVRTRPPPARKIVGNLSDSAKVLMVLDLPGRTSAPEQR